METVGGRIIMTDETLVPVSETTPIIDAPLPSHTGYLHRLLTWLKFEFEVLELDIEAELKKL